MKNYIMLLVLLLVVVSSYAQDLSPWQGVRHSAVDINGNLNFLFNTVPGDFNGYEFHYIINGGAWNTTVLNDIGAGLMRTQVPYQYGQNLKYRLKGIAGFEDEIITYLNPSFLDSDTFPPAINQMALSNTDATGDSLMYYHAALDITSSYFGVSANKFHSAITNVSGAFPVMVSLTSYNLYMSMLMNPESAVGDSIVFAMVHTFNIAGIISPGLYKIGMGEGGEPSFERIGNIQSQVSGGRLFMSCNIADLINDPDFGAWPNDMNALANSIASMRINLDLSTMTPEFLIGDYTNPGIIEFVDRRYQESSNSLPLLVYPVVQNAEGGHLVTVGYDDANEDFPLISQLELSNGTIYPMTATEMDYSEQVSYSTFVPSSEDWSSAELRFSDNGINFVTVEVYPSSVPDANSVIKVLQCNMPNPLPRGSVDIMVKGLDASKVDFDIYNIKGQHLGKIDFQHGGQHEFTLSWDSSVNGKRLQAGVYFMRIKQGSRQINRKFVVLP